MDNKVPNQTQILRPVAMASGAMPMQYNYAPQYIQVFIVIIILFLATISTTNYFNDLYTICRFFISASRCK